MRDIKIDGAGSRFQYQLRRGLVSFVSIDPKARYALSISVDIKRTSLAITADDEITRFNFEAITKYKLVGVADDPVIDGETRAITSVNATTDTFATQSSERAAMQKLADATSEKLITALRLISLRAKSEK
ncbi:MAG: hypothetical protein MRY74_04090 [Neomegalonema sp.]|nr:hypothetical protein [Neomegalonema sp.]